MSILLDNRLYSFLTRIFLRVPFLLLSSIIEQLFFQSLIKVEGSSMKIREKLWKTVDKQDSKMIVRFIQLGRQLGFTEWSINKIKTETLIPNQYEKPLSLSNPDILNTIHKFKS